MYTLEEAVSDNYGKMVTYLKSRNIYDDDVFQNTVVSCFKIFRGKEIHKENVFRYFLSSYKQNRLRNRKYAWESRVDCHDELPELQCTTESPSSRCDYVKLREFFYENFGKENTQLLRKYNMGGYTIKDLETEHNVKGLYYLFKKMSAAAKKEFPELLECRKEKNLLNRRFQRFHAKIFSKSLSLKRIILFGSRFFTTS